MRGRIWPRILAYFLLNLASLTASFSFSEIDCRCESCVNVPKPRKPDFSGLNSYLEEEKLQPEQELLRLAVARKENGTVATLKFGFLIEMKYFNTMGAVSLAVESVNEDRNLLRNIHLDFVFDRIYSK